MTQADDVPPIPSAESATDAPPINAETGRASKLAEAAPGEAAENKAPDQTNEPAQKVSAAKPHAKTGQGSKHARAAQQPKTKPDKRGNNGQTVSGIATPDETGDLARRLLARFELPKTALDRGLVPPELLVALDAAGLGSPDVLPSATFMTLAAIIAVAGPHVSFLACTDDKLKGMLPATGLSLRIVLLTEERRSSVVPAAILAGVYSAENMAIDAYLNAIEGSAAQQRASAKLRLLHEQATRAAAELGIAPPPPFAKEAPIDELARPRIVLPCGAYSTIIDAAAGGTGTLVIDGRWMKSMSNVGNNFDEATAALLTSLSLGHQIPVADPEGRTTMRTLPACVIGQLTAAECATLHKADRDQFGATIFARAATAPVNADSSGLIALMSRAHGMAGAPVALHLSESAQHRLATAAGSWASLAATALPPLCDFLAGLPDLARRLAAAMHIVAAGGEDKMTTEIPLAAVKRAVTIVDNFVAPVAQALLGSLSTGETERDARRMVGYLREHTSATNREIERRPWMRAWQKSMPIARFDAALALLQQEKLLISLDKIEGKANGGQRFEVAPIVYGAT